MMSLENQKIGFAMLGAGRAAQLHMDSFTKLGSESISFEKVFAKRVEQLEGFAEKYRFRGYCTDLEEILVDESIDVVDICTPPYLHYDMIIRAAKAGKHIICEKPLIGFFGGRGESVSEFSHEVMLAKVMSQLKDIQEIVSDNNVKLMYAENFLYAPAIVKAGEIIKARKSKILFMHGEESLNGSTSPVAGYWEKTGGGVLIRNAIHPLSAILWLKKQEALARNEKIRLESVYANMGRVGENLLENEKAHLLSKAVDVEDTCIVTLSFSDGTKGVVFATDVMLGGTKNEVEIYCNDTVLNCTITSNNLMRGFFADEDGLDGISLAETLNVKTGWSLPFVADETIRGYDAEISDFINSLLHDCEPRSGIGTACEDITVVYAAYASAWFNKPVFFDDLNCPSLQSGHGLSLPMVDFNSEPVRLDDI
jgi:predicted dehydrogenase